jgi:hypothetical protein
MQVSTTSLLRRIGAGVNPSELSRTDNSPARDARETKHPALFFVPERQKPGGPAQTQTD